MTWIALADHRERRFSLKGLGMDRKAEPVLAAGTDRILAVGSLMFETQIAPDDRPKVLLGFNVTTPHQRSLTFQAIPGGGIALVQVYGQDVTHAALQHVSSSRADVLRVTYSWDAPKGWAQLTVERPEENTLVTTQVDTPRPLNLSDLRDMMMGRGNHTLANDVLYAALSDQVEPVGPMPTMAPDTPIATPMGYKAARNLKRGDTVYVRGGDIVPVLQTVSRTVPARGSFAPVRLRAPYFGLQQDVIVSPEQRIVLDGSAVEYLFSEEAVLAPARHLVNGFAAMQAHAGPVMPYTQLVLPGHEPLLAAGAPMDSLYIGRIRRKTQDLANSLMADMDRTSLPEHGRESFKVLKWFEAIQIATSRAA